MKCPYCGAEMQVTSQNFVCPSCQVVLQPMAQPTAPVHEYWKKANSNEQPITPIDDDQKLTRAQRKSLKKKQKDKPAKVVANKAKSSDKKSNAGKIAIVVLLLIANILTLALSFCPIVEVDPTTLLGESVSLYNIKDLTVKFSLYDYVEMMVVSCFDFETENEMENSKLYDKAIDKAEDFSRALQKDIDNSQNGTVELSKDTCKKYAAFTKAVMCVQLSFKAENGSATEITMIVGAVLSLLTMLFAATMLGVLIAALVNAVKDVDGHFHGLAIPVAMNVVLLFVYVIHALTPTGMQLSVGGIVSLATVAAVVLLCVGIALAHAPRGQRKNAISKVVSLVFMFAVLGLSFAPAFTMNVNGYNNGELIGEYKYDIGIGEMQSCLVTDDEATNLKMHGYYEMISLANGTTNCDYYLNSEADAFFKSGLAQIRVTTVFDHAIAVYGNKVEENQIYSLIYFFMLMVGLLTMVDTGVVLGGMLGRKYRAFDIILRVLCVGLVIAMLSMSCIVVQHCNTLMASIEMDASIGWGVIVMLVLSVLGFVAESICYHAVKGKRVKIADEPVFEF